MRYRISEIQKALSPNPFGLLSSLKTDGTTNLMAVSWWTFVSNNPATIAVCLSRKGLSGELIRNSSEFALNIVGEELKEKAFQCGTCSGRNVNKASDFEIPLKDSDMLHIQIIDGAKAVMECKLVGELAVSDHNIFIGEVIETHCIPEKKHLYAFEGYARLDTI